MNAEKRIEALEDTVKVLKNEINTVLLDIREHYLDLENPFNQYCRVAPEPAASGDVPEKDADQDITPPLEENPLAEGETEVLEGLASTSRPALEIPAEYKPGINRKMDWVTVVGLTRWVERATSNLGKAKVEALIEVYYSTGCLSDTFRELLIKMIRLSEAEAHKGQVTSRDYLSTLVQLESILNGDGQREAALLSILSDGEGLQ